MKTLKCSQKNDRFTVNDTNSGNGSLTYPVGLLTTDEAILAGGYSSNNSGYYLYTGNDYWTMTPSKFNGEISFVESVTSSGYAVMSTSINANYGIRPVINLKPNSLKSGDGSVLNPYLVET